jgi:hypothetical protein
MFYATLTLDNQETGRLIWTSVLYDSKDYSKRYPKAYYSDLSLANLKAKVLSHGFIDNAHHFLVEAKLADHPIDFPTR